MFDRLILSIGMFLNIAPFAFLCYSPFMDNLRVSTKKLILVLSAFFVLQFVINFSFYSMSFLAVQIIFYISFAFCFILYFFTIKVSFLKLLFVFLVVANYASIIVGTANFLIPNFFPSYLTSTGNNVYTLPGILIDLALYAITAPIIVYLFYKGIKPILKLSNSKIWSTLWVIPLMFIFTLVVFSSANQAKIMESWEYFAVVLTISIGSFIVYYLILKMLYETEENATLKENARMTERQLILEREHYQMLTSHIEEANRARHDLRHHILLIRTYIDDGNRELLTKHIEQYQLAVPEDTSVSLCLNYTVDVIVRYYIQLAKHAGIDVKIQLNLPAAIGVADADLCIVFGNLLENAIEACKRQKELAAFITIGAEFAGDNVVITVDNSLEGDILKENDTFISSKRSSNGIGLTSVQAVAQKYDGVAKFEYEKNIFRASVMLQCLK